MAHERQNNVINHLQDQYKIGQQDLNKYKAECDRVNTEISKNVGLFKSNEKETKLNEQRLYACGEYQNQLESNAQIQAQLVDFANGNYDSEPKKQIG